LTILYESSYSNIVYATGSMYIKSPGGKSGWYTWHILRHKIIGMKCTRPDCRDITPKYPCISNTIIVIPRSSKNTGIYTGNGVLVTTYDGRALVAYRIEAACAYEGVAGVGAAGGKDLVINTGAYKRVIGCGADAVVYTGAYEALLCVGKVIPAAAYYAPKAGDHVVFSAQYGPIRGAGANFVVCAAANCIKIAAYIVKRPSADKAEICWNGGRARCIDPV
jgi:hypothetical protein